MNRTKIIKRMVQILVGLLIVFILYRIGLRNFWKVLQTVNISWLIPVFLLVIPVQILATVNIAVLLLSINKKVPFKKLLRAVTLSFSLGKFSPVRMGEFSLILFLKNKNISYGEGLAIAILDKLITFIIFSILALIGFLLFFNLELFFVILTGCVFFVALLVYFIFSNKIRYLIRKYLLKKYSKYFKGFSITFKYIIKKRIKYLLLNIIITLFKWIISFYSHWFLFRAFGLNISLKYIILISSIVNIVSLAPISLSGLGLRESSGTYLYSTILNIAPVIAINVMLIETVKVYIIATLFYLINLELIQKIKFKNKEPNLI